MSGAKWCSAVCGMPAFNTAPKLFSYLDRFAFSHTNSMGRVNGRDFYSSYRSLFTGPSTDSSARVPQECWCHVPLVKHV